MPYSEKQRRLFFADAKRAARGKATVTGMTEAKLLQEAHAPLKRPMRFKAKR